MDVTRTGTDAPQGRTRVLAHRGYHAGGAPENSMAAFRAGHALGAVLELDVQRTRDGVLVINHDAKLEDGRTIAELNAAELPVLANGEPMPTLVQVADFARSSGARLAVELKERGYEQQAMGELFSRVPTSQADVISFNSASIEAVEAINPEIRTGMLEPRLPAWLRNSPVMPAAVWLMDKLDWHPALTSTAKHGADYVSIEEQIATPKFLADARERGIPVDVWTVNDPEKMRGFLREGVQSLVTDDPDTALALRAGTLPAAPPVPTELPLQRKAS